jgi:hypothetical protein
LLDRVVHYRPRINEVEDWADYLCAQPKLAFDIETKAKQITCIGFAPSKLESFVIPFWTRSGNYWDDPADEARAYRAVRRICKSPAIKIAQNGLWDCRKQLPPRHDDRAPRALPGAAEGPRLPGLALHQ